MRKTRVMKEESLWHFSPALTFNVNFMAEKLIKLNARLKTLENVPFNNKDNIVLEAVFDNLNTSVGQLEQLCKKLGV